MTLVGQAMQLGLLLVLIFLILFNSGLISRNRGKIVSSNGLVSWEVLNQQLSKDFHELNWKPHIAIVAPTRGGKTTLAIKGIMPHFTNALILDTTSDPNPPMRGYGEPLKKYGPIEGHRRLTISAMDWENKNKVHKALERVFAQ